MSAASRAAAARVHSRPTGAVVPRHARTGEKVARGQQPGDGPETKARARVEKGGDAVELRRLLRRVAAVLLEERKHAVELGARVRRVQPAQLGVDGTPGSGETGPRQGRACVLEGGGEEGETGRARDWGSSATHHVSFSASVYSTVGMGSAWLRVQWGKFKWAGVSGRDGRMTAAQAALQHCRPPQDAPVLDGNVGKHGAALAVLGVRKAGVVRLELCTSVKHTVRKHVLRKRGRGEHDMRLPFAVGSAAAAAAAGLSFPLVSLARHTGQAGPTHQLLDLAREPHGVVRVRVRVQDVGLGLELLLEAGHNVGNLVAALLGQDEELVVVVGAL